MIDRLEKIVRRNRNFQKRFFADRGLDIDKLSPADMVYWTKDYVLHIEGELHELMGETNWKMHKIGGAPPIISNIKEEWIDSLKFLIGLANIWGFNADDIMEEFERKSQVVEYRYGMEQRLRSISPQDSVVAVDIDGVLNEYPRVFYNWLIENAPEFQGRQYLDRLTVNEKIDSSRYLELKDIYRQSGAKRYQAVREGARELLNGIRAAGGTVILLSKRPFWKFSRIYADTLEWLDNNGLRFDAVLFDRDKHCKILKDFPGLVAMVEDNPNVAREILSIGKPVVLVRGDMNIGIEVTGAKHADGPIEALNIITELLKEKNNG
jgi:hypothetical protein